MKDIQKFVLDDEISVEKLCLKLSVDETECKYLFILYCVMLSTSIVAKIVYKHNFHGEFTVYDNDTPSECSMVCDS